MGCNLAWERAGCAVVRIFATRELAQDEAGARREKALIDMYVYMHFEGEVRRCDLAKAQALWYLEE